MMHSFSYIHTRSLDEAIRYLSEDGARVHGGGTDLLGCLRDGVLKASTIVSISRIKELQMIRETPEGGVRIGALTTLSEVARNPIIKARYRALAEAASEVASPQLRNQGTLGGNLCQKPRCWYYRGEFHCLRKGGDQCFAEYGENQYHCIFGGENCFIVHPSDTASVLVALEASVRITGPKAERTVAAENFHVPPSEDLIKETVLEPGEILTAILLPPPPAGLRSSYRKVRGRRSWDFALAGLALAVLFKGDQVARSRVVLSGAAPVPWRSMEVEEVIKERRLDSDTVSKAVDAVVKNAEPMEQNGYKIPLFRGIMEEQLMAIA